MEIARAWGLEPALRARSVEVDWRLLLAETLAGAAAGTPVEVGYPSPAESRMVSPAGPACVAQDDVERVFLDHLRAVARAVHLGCEVTAVHAGPGGARVTLRDVRTDARNTVHARYLVAADGARSTLRRALDIPVSAPEGVMEGFTTLFHAPLWDVVGEHRHLIYSMTTGPPASSSPPASPTAGCSAATATPPIRRARPR
jgi:2-polyprenyl-6-methoxyphenol hydroxylase-like FAD-dependent oxidoreductase